MLYCKYSTNFRFDSVILAGDINIDVLQETSIKSRLTSILDSYSMYCKVNFPTRIAVTRSSGIDNILTNLDKDIINLNKVIT